MKYMIIGLFLLFAGNIYAQVRGTVKDLSLIHISEVREYITSLGVPANHKVYGCVALGYACLLYTSICLLIFSHVRSTFLNISVFMVVHKRIWLLQVLHSLLLRKMCIRDRAIVIRVLNPGYPEGMMLAILLMNIFAPLIDCIDLVGAQPVTITDNKGKVTGYKIAFQFNPTMAVSYTHLFVIRYSPRQEVPYVVKGCLS